jgi:hypothetical protein
VRAGEKGQQDQDPHRSDEQVHDQTGQADPESAPLTRCGLSQPRRENAEDTAADAGHQFCSTASADARAAAPKNAPSGQRRRTKQMEELTREIHGNVCAGSKPGAFGRIEEQGLRLRALSRSQQSATAAVRSISRTRLR